MLKRRVPRVLLAGFVLTVAVSGLSACKTSPNVAAYVGDAQVTVDEVQAAVAERLADEGVAQWASGREDDLTRQVLTLLVEREVHAAAAERYGVRVDDAQVRRQLEALIGDRDADALYEEAAVSQGVSREDVFENVRQQLVQQEIAEAEGKVEPPSEAELRARYEEVREDLAEVSFGYITVPDEATASAVLAQLTADPAAYPAVAAQYPGATTLTALETRARDAVPAPLAEGIAAAAPNTGFSLPVPEVGGVIVTFVAGKVYPPFEDVRPQLEQEGAGAAQAAGGELVDGVREDLGITVNPRFGLVLEKGRLVPGGDSGVVKFLEEDGGEPPADPATAGN